MVAVPLAIPIASAGITGARVAGPYIANLVRQYGPTIVKGIFNALNRDEVMTGEDLENISVEEREAKKKERAEKLRNIRGNRAAGIRADEVKGAAERGDYGQLEMSKKDDDIIDVKEEDLIREEKKDVSTGGEDPNEDPNKKNIIFDDAQTVARKLTEQGIGELIDRSIDNLEKKYTKINEKRKFDLYQADPSTLDDSLKADIVAQIYQDNLSEIPFTSSNEGVLSIMDIISNAVPGVKAKETALKLLNSKGIKHERVLTSYETDKNTENILKSVQQKREYPIETRNKVIDYLKENDRYKTIASTQIMKDLKLEPGVDFNIDAIRKIRTDLNLKPTVVKKDSLDKARITFRNMLRKVYDEDLGIEEYSRLTQAFTDYIVDANLGVDKPKGFTKEMIMEAYDYATKERMKPSFEEEIYQDFFLQLRKKNIENMELVNKQLIAEGKEPIINPEKSEGQNLAVFRKWSMDKNNPDVFLTMGHARFGTEEGQMGFADSRMYEPETIRKNMESRKYGNQLKSAWGDSENPDNIEKFIRIAREMEAADIRQIFQVPNSDQTILIGRAEPKPFPSEQKIFEFKKDGGMVGISHLTRPL